MLGHHETDNCLDSYLNSKWHNEMMQELYRPYKKAYIKLFISTRDMDVKMVPIVNLVRNLPSYFSGGISAAITGQIERTVDFESNGGVIYMKHENEYQLKKDVEFLERVEKDYFDILSHYQYGRSIFIFLLQKFIVVDICLYQNEHIGICLVVVNQ